MGLGYASEKLGTAVLSAMQSKEPLQKRLHGCYLIFHTLHHQDDLPPDLKKRFNEMIRVWSRLPDPAGVEGTVAVTTAKMNDQEARKWLEEVFSLYTEVTQREAVSENQP
jgi:hypothetical protein